MKSLLLKFISLTGKLSWPLSQKKFKLSDYLEITNYFEENDIKYALFLVSTNGAFSNFLIKTSYLFGGKNKFSKYTHSGLYIGSFYYEDTVLEAIGEGVQTRTLLEAIGNRDNVKILIPSKKMNKEVIKNARNYAIEIAKKDREEPIEYDSSHNLYDNSSYDCSELVYTTLVKGFESADQKCPLLPVNRFGQENVAPIDLEYSDLFEVIYDNKIGFIDGKI